MKERSQSMAKRLSCLFFTLLTLGCDERTEPSSFTQCIIGRVVVAEKLSAFSSLEEACEYNYEVQLRPEELKALTSFGLAWNKRTEQQHGQEPIVYFDLEVRNENLDWRITAISVLVTLDTEKGIKEEHPFRVRIRPASKVDLPQLRLRNQTTIREGNWNFQITGGRGVRLNPKTTHWSDRLFGQDHERP
jgi:hypothetical protein